MRDLGSKTGDEWEGGAYHNRTDAIEFVHPFAHCGGRGPGTVVAEELGAAFGDFDFASRSEMAFLR